MSVTDAPTGILTFLIADIRGYTGFTQTHGDEAAARLAGKFAEVAIEGVQAHGGEVTELRGDEALAVFTSPRAALRAALDLQVVFGDETALDSSLPLPVGIGLDAGEAVPVQGGYRGGALNLAARLCARAGAGEVLVSQGVAHLARAVDGIELVEHGDAEVKGLAGPVRVFRAVDGRPALEPVPRREPAAALPSELDTAVPMVGRDADLRRLRWMWRQARRGAGRCAVIQGPTGIGKTRLAAAVAATVVGSGGECRYLTGASAPAPLDWAALLGGVPGMVVLDDLEADGGRLLADLAAQATWLGSTPTLVLLVFDDGTAADDIVRAAHRLTDPDRIVRPKPLDLDQMLQIAALYLGPAVDAVPQHLLTGTGGNPRKLHEDVSSWAHSEATRRLGVLAAQAASGRSGLRTVESDLAGTVIDLQQVRERMRLYGLGPGRHAPEPEQAPYRGLASFDVGDADLFFGRERLVAELISRLAGASLLGVVGPSGSGKSSAVRAGLLPALAGGVLPGSESWSVALLRPGEHPTRVLERALGTSLPPAVLARMESGVGGLAGAREVLGSDDRLLVVVDQFEELFTTCTDEEERAEFLAALIDAARDPRGRTIVVLAVRADFYGRCAADPRLAELLAANHVLVGPMTAEEYRRAIVQPALRVGVTLEPELVDDLVAEVLGEAGALPLLSTALLELWDHRDGRTIRRSAYLATGGVRGAVGRLADDAYEGLDEPGRDVARSILLRLAGPGEGVAVVRRRVPLAEFDAERNVEVAAALDVLTRRRLVTVSDGTVEVAHEALLREWPRLQAWLEEDREGRRLHAHLAQAAQEWSHRDRDPAELYRGARLSAALDWTTQHTVELNELERDFVTSSREESQRELTRQRAQNRRLRGLLAGVAGVLVLALIAGAVALVQRHAAQNSARVALARQLGAEAVSAGRIDQAMLLAREAVLLDRSPNTEGTLLATLLRDPAVLGTFTVPIDIRPLQIALSPDGRTLAVADNSGQLHFLDTRTHGQVAKLSDAAGGPFTYAGRYFVSGAPDGPPGFRVYDGTTHRVLVRDLLLSTVWLNNPTSQVEPLLVDPSANLVFNAYAVVHARRHVDGPAYLEAWDISTGRHRLVQLPGVGMVGATLLPGGGVLVVTDNAAITVNERTLRTVVGVPLHVPALAEGAVSPDGRTAAFIPTGANGVPANTFSLVDLRTGQVTPAAGSHSAGIVNLAYSPDGRRIITTSDDTTVKVWDATTGALMDTLTGHSARVLGIAFSADGRTLYTASLDGAVFVWDLAGSRRFGRPFSVSAGPLPPAPFQVPALAVSPDGSSFATRIGPGTVGVYSVASLRQEHSFVTGARDVDVTSLAWSAQGLLALPAETGVQIWAMRGSPTLLRTLTGLRGAVQVLAFTADGSRLVAGTAVPPLGNGPGNPDGWAGAWDVTTGQLVFARHVGSDVPAIAVSADGTRIAVSRDNTNGTLILSGSGQVVRTVRGLGANGTSWALRFQGHNLLMGTWAGIVQQFDPATGRQLARPVLVEGAPVSSLALAPTGGLFAVSGGSAGGVKLWAQATLQQFGATFPGGQGQWGNAAYTPDGASLVVVYGDGTAAVWPTSVSAWMAHACAVAGRNFSHEEWSRFVPGHPYRTVCPGYPIS